jgi:enterochelin esterase-like enzyme
VIFSTSPQTPVNRVRPILAQVSLLAALLAQGQPATPVARPKCDETTGQIVGISLTSQVYGKPVPVNVYLPPCYDGISGAFPVVYLLHGGGSDETQWPDLGVRSEADALIASGAPSFVVVMPGGEYIWTLDYEAFVLNELIPVIEKDFSVRTDKSGRAIGGLSLGGYWALRIAFRHPDLFTAVGGNSPVTARGEPDDPIQLAQSAAGLDQLQIALDVGDMDSLRSDTQQLANVLQARGLPISFVINPGEHARPYWRSHTDEYLRFYVKALNPAPARPHRCLHP